MHPIDLSHELHECYRNTPHLYCVLCIVYCVLHPQWIRNTDMNTCKVSAPLESVIVGNRNGLIMVNVCDSVDDYDDLCLALKLFSNQ